MTSNLKVLTKVNVYDIVDSLKSAPEDIKRDFLNYLVQEFIGSHIFDDCVFWESDVRDYMYNDKQIMQDIYLDNIDEINKWLNEEDNDIS